MKSSIKKIRKTLRLNQSDFGRKVGVKATAISNYEIGFRVPEIEIAYNILDLAKSNGIPVTLEDIYTRDCKKFTTPTLRKP